MIYDSGRKIGPRRRGIKKICRESDMSAQKYFTDSPRSLPIWNKIVFQEKDYFVSQLSEQTILGMFYTHQYQSLSDDSFVIYIVCFIQTFLNKTSYNVLFKAGNLSFTTGIKL